VLNVEKRGSYDEQAFLHTASCARTSLAQSLIYSLTESMRPATLQLWRPQ